MGKNLRILIATDHYPPYLGGAHRQTYLLARELFKRGHAVTVATVWHPGLSECEEQDGVEVHRFKQIRTLKILNPEDRHQRHQPPFPDPVTVIGLRRLIKQWKPDLVHSHGWFSYSCAAALIGTDIPLIISGRDYGYACATRTLLFRDQLCSGPQAAKCMQCATQFYRSPKGILSVIGLAASRKLLLSRLRGVHTVSRFVMDRFQSDFLRGDRARLEAGPKGLVECAIPSFLIQNDRATHDPAILENLPAQPFMLFVGGMQPRKGLNTLLEAYTRLKDPIPLVMIGYATPDMPTQFPEGVTVLLDVPHSGVMEAWKRCLFGVVPSVWPDPSPGVVREAFSMGRPVIGTNVGGTPEMIGDAECGLLVASNDSDELAAAMQRLIDDQTLRERLGSQALERAAQYQAEVVIPQFELLYQEVLLRNPAAL